MNLQYECEKCYDVFNSMEECLKHIKEKEHYTFKLRGTNLVLAIG